MRLDDTLWIMAALGISVIFIFLLYDLIHWFPRGWLKVVISIGIFVIIVGGVYEWRRRIDDQRYRVENK